MRWRAFAMVEKRRSDNPFALQIAGWVVVHINARMAAEDCQAHANRAKQGAKGTLLLGQKKILRNPCLPSRYLSYLSGDRLADQITRWRCCNHS